MKKISILLVDNDYISNYINVNLFNSLQIPVHSSIAGNPDEALVYLKENSQNLPDYIFLELNYPTTAGIDFLDEFYNATNKLYKDIKIIILSNLVNPNITTVLMKYPIHNYLLKPLTKKSLNDSIKETLIQIP